MLQDILFCLLIHYVPSPHQRLAAMDLQHPPSLALILHSVDCTSSISWTLLRDGCFQCSCPVVFNVHLFFLVFLYRTLLKHKSTRLPPNSLPQIAMQHYNCRYKARGRPHKRWTNVITEAVKKIAVRQTREEKRRKKEKEGTV
jgi:hypothetical protein